jgi:hypothetical protein
VPTTFEDGIVNVTGIVTATPALAFVTLDAEMLDGVEIPNALAEGVTTTESIPKPKVETATSAMRLRVVFVDICFLSLVVKETFSLTAGRD